MMTKPTSKQIDVAAQAIHAVVGTRGGRGRSWDSLTPRMRQEFREEAKAALIAAQDTSRMNYSNGKNAQFRIAKLASHCLAA